MVQNITNRFKLACKEWKKQRNGETLGQDTEQDKRTSDQENVLDDASNTFLKVQPQFATSNVAQQTFAADTEISQGQVEEIMRELFEEP